MNMGKTAIEGLFLLLCINFALWYLNERQIFPVTSINFFISPQDVVEDPSLNATATASGFGTGIVSYFLANIIPTLQIIARLLTFSLIGLPAFLFAIGCPTPIATILTALYGIVWLLAVAEIIRGFKIGQ